MEFTALDGDTFKVSEGREAVIVKGWSEGQYIFLAFDPDTADEIASALTAMARKAREAQ